jgi:hypothetical protein
MELPKNTEIVPIWALRDTKTKLVIRTFYDLAELLEYLRTVANLQIKNEKNP